MSSLVVQMDELCWELEWVWLRAEAKVSSLVVQMDELCWELEWVWLRA